MPLSEGTPRPVQQPTSRGILAAHHEGSHEARPLCENAGVTACPLMRVVPYAMPPFPEKSPNAAVPASYTGQLRHRVSLFRTSTSACMHARSCPCCLAKQPESTAGTRASRSLRHRPAARRPRTPQARKIARARISAALDAERTARMVRLFRFASWPCLVRSRL